MVVQDMAKGATYEEIKKHEWSLISDAGNIVKEEGVPVDEILVRSSRMVSCPPAVPEGTMTFLVDFYKPENISRGDFYQYQSTLRDKLRGLPQVYSVQEITMMPKSIAFRVWVKV